MKKRNNGLDLLRITLCLFVIAIHSLGHLGNENVYVDMFLPTILGAANGLFYMLSGYFNLNKEFKNSSDIKKFYKNKIIYVLCPFLAFNLFWVAWDYLHAFGSVNILDMLSVYYRTVVSSSAEGHMWFMYPLFGMLLATPFLSKMLHSMKDDELKLMWRIAIGYNVFAYFLCENFGISFRVLSWVFEGWTIYYFAGYYFRRVVSKESSVKWISLGLLGYFVTCLGINSKLPIFEQFVGGNDMQPMYTLFCMGLLYVWNKYVVIENHIIGKITSFLAANAYLVYLFHTRGIEYAVRKLHVVDSNVVSWFTVVFGAFVISLIAAVVTNFIMKPVQKLVDKTWVIK